MITLGLILLILGLIFGLGGKTLLWVGGALVILGLVFNFLPVGNRRYRVW